MKGKLLKQALFKFFSGAISVACMIFLPAGTLHYWNAWLFMGLLFLPMLIAGFVLMFKNPSLLQKRLKAKETRSEQKAVIFAGGIMFFAGFVLSGLNFRFSWWILPRWAVAAAAAVFVLAYILYGEVLRENTYLSRTVEIQEGQTVVDTGLYGIVRHPMYAVTLLLFFSMPLVLGAAIALIPFLAYPALLVKRILNEEKLLEENLIGYKAYEQKVKYRLIPFVW